MAFHRSGIALQASAGFLALGSLFSGCTRTSLGAATSPAATANIVQTATRVVPSTTVSDGNTRVACPDGGSVVQTYQDTNANGTWDKGEPILTSYEICNGAPGARGLGAGIEVAAAASCSAGGALITTYVDANNDGIRQSTEHVTSVSSVCNGVTGAPGAAGLSSTVSMRDATLAQCANQGTVISVANGTQTPIETVICNGGNGSNGTNGINGHDGLSASIVSAAASAADCPQGGTTYTVNDGHGGMQSTPVCNGLIGQTGSTGSTGAAGASVVFSSVAVAPSCAQGGTTVLMAYDSNHNGVLDLSDDGLQTTVICNGVDGAPGTNPPSSSFAIDSIVNPCGDNPNLYDEVFLRLANGTLLASFSDSAAGGNTRLSILVPGTYTTTDGDNCVFTVDSHGVISGENHRF